MFVVRLIVTFLIIPPLLVFATDFGAFCIWKQQLHVMGLEKHGAVIEKEKIDTLLIDIEKKL